MDTHIRTDAQAYDTIIIGAGPAGMAAAMYNARYGLKTLLLTLDVGGQMATADKVENYPGYKSIHGMELMQKFMEQVEFSKLVSKAKADKLVNILENLEKLDDVRKIIELAAK